MEGVCVCVCVFTRILYGILFRFQIQSSDLLLFMPPCHCATKANCYRNVFSKSRLPQTDNNPLAKLHTAPQCISHGCCVCYYYGNLLFSSCLAYKMILRNNNSNNNNNNNNNNAWGPNGRPQPLDIVSMGIVFRYDGAVFKNYSYTLSGGIFYVVFVDGKRCGAVATAFTFILYAIHRGACS